MADLAVDRRIVLVDQEPLREAVILETRQLMRSLEEARLELHEFKTVSRVAYDRWMATTFGALLTRRRELGEAIARTDSLINDVHLLVMAHGGSLRAAYRRLMRDRQCPEFVFPEGDQRAEEEAEESPGDSDHSDPREAAERAMFESSLREYAGIDPHSLPKAEYDKLYSEFRRTFFEGEAGQRRARDAQGQPEVERPSHQEIIAPRKLKELYRTLVRRLHPDMRADADPTVSALWHEVQEAYARGDAERLETLLALCEMQADAITTATSLSQLITIRDDLQRDLDAVRRELRRCQEDPAWKFDEQSAEKLGETILRQLETQISRLAGELAQLEQLIESWQPKSRSSPAKKRRTRRSHDPVGTLDLFEM